MIRFLPDTWTDALLRPLAMAAPNSWVYTEISSPDIRFSLALLLALPAIFVLIKRKKFGDAFDKPLFALLALTLLSFIPWLVTTGNGRYFMPYILLVGPLCIGLIRALTCTNQMKVSISVLFIFMQGFVLSQNNPWHPYDAWASTNWGDDGYFSLDIDPGTIDPDTTYVTIGANSMSAIAPLFPSTSHWIRLTSLSQADVITLSSNYLPVKRILDNSKTIKLIQRNNPRAMNLQRDQPNRFSIETFNSHLGAYRLAIRQPTDCILYPSRTLITTTLVSTDESESEKARIRSKTGFWACTLTYPMPLIEPIPLTADQKVAIKVFERIEALCPRFFPRGQIGIGPHKSGVMRYYSESDASLIVTRDKNVYVKNFLALNPEHIGSISAVMNSTFRLDCTNFRGRSGLPWEREI